MNKEEILERVRTLNVARSGGRRAPYKPLLLLLAIAKLQGGVRQLPFAEVEKSLGRLFQSFAPPIRSRQQPKLPYWYLQSDKIWEISNAESITRQRGGFPNMKSLRETSGMLVGDVQRELRGDPVFAGQVIQELLDRHFPPSLHQELASAIGFTLPNVISEAAPQERSSRQRDPNFRRLVLQAYEHRCAVTGFQSLLGGVQFGCEAAHIRWHGDNGPDIVQNGLVLEPTIHKLFDAGAWTLTDDWRILVSRDFSGDEEAIRRLRSHHGKSIRKPLDRDDLPRAEFIRWHREPKLGGVFREPALKL